MNELLQVEVGKDQKCTLSEWRDKLLKWISESKSWNLFQDKTQQSYQEKVRKIRGITWAGQKTEKKIDNTTDG